MTREEAKELLTCIMISYIPKDQYGDYDDPEPYEEAIEMAIEALKQSSNSTQLLNDGTLKVKVADVLDIKRVMVMDNHVIYDSYYPDRQQGEWLLECDGGNECDNLYKCSICGVECGCEEYDKPNFCPNCGADMSIYSNIAL